MKNIRIEASLDAEKNNYYLTSDGNILEISRQEKAENPFRAGACVGNITYGFTPWEAFDELSAVLDNETRKEIERRANLPENSRRNDLETMLRHCEEKRVDVSDLLLYEHIDFGNFDGIAYIDQKELDRCTDLVLKDLTGDEKQFLVDDMKDKINQWENGDVYACALYNKEGEEVTDLFNFS